LKDNTSTHVTDVACTTGPQDTGHAL